MGNPVTFFSSHFWALPLPKTLFKPLPDINQIVKKWSLPTKISNFLLLHNADPFKGHTIGHVGVVVHAVCNKLTLRRQRETLKQSLGSQDPFLQAAVLSHFEGMFMCSPDVGGMSLINVDQ